MRIPSGTTDQYLYFVAVDSTDFTTRKPTLSSFTVYRSRDGGASSAMTTPTINETDATNMQGVYELLLDEDMTIDSGNETEEMVFHITHAGMAPVSRTIELFNPHDLSKYSGPRGPGVYLDDAAANTNTVNYTDGTAINAVSTIAAAKTIADSLGIDRIYIRNDTAITLAATMTDYEFVGIGTGDLNAVALASQDVSQSTFHNLTITGVQGGSGRAQFEDCIFGTATVHCLAKRCGFTDATTGVTVSNDDDNIFDQCFSMVAGNSTPIFIVSGANNDTSFRHYSGGIELQSTNATATVSIETDGQVIFDATCSTSTNVTIRGMATITDNTGGMSSLTTGAAFGPRMDDVEGATFDTSTDSLEAIRNRGDSDWTTGGGTGLSYLASGTCQTPADNTEAVLAASSTFADGELVGNVINITGGTGAGQSRVITGYTGSTDTADVTPNWTTTLDNTSTYEVVFGSANVTAVGGAAQDLPTATALAVVDTNVDQIEAAVITNAAGVDIAADIAAVKAETATIVTDTNELQADWTDGGRLDLIVDAILVDTGTTLENHLTDIKGTGFVKDTDSLTDIRNDTDVIDDGTSGLVKIATDVAAILVDTTEIGTAGAGLTDLGGMSTGMKAEVNAECDTAVSDGGLALISGTVNDATPAVGSFSGSAGLGSKADDFYNGCFLVFTDGPCAGIARMISDYTDSSVGFSFTGAVGELDEPFPVAPNDTNAFKILGRGE